jgi:hypothetical protein
MRTASAFRATEHEYLFKGGGDSRKVAQCQARREHLIRGIAATEWFLYEIMLVCLIITLTSLDEPLKIGDIPKTKKAADPLSAFTKAPELPTAIRNFKG